MRTLVIGGGFLGVYVILELLKNANNSCTVVDVKEPTSFYSHPLLAPFQSDKRLEYRWQSIGDVLSLKTDFNTGIDNIVYTSAIADVPFAIKSPKATYQTNVNNTLDFYEYLRQTDFGGRIIMMSSESVLGHQPEERLHIETVTKPDNTTTSIARGLREDECIPNPANIYGASKLGQENIARMYWNSYGIRSIIFRSATMFGPYSRLKQVIPIFVRQALTMQPITLEGDGSQTRDFCYVTNTSGIIAKTLINPDTSIDGEVFHIGTGREQIFAQLAKSIKSIIGAGVGEETRITNGPWRAGEKGLRVVLDISKARDKLRYEPDTELIQRIIDVAIWIANYVEYLPDEKIEAMVEKWGRAATRAKGTPAEKEKLAQDEQTRKDEYLKSLGV